MSMQRLRNVMLGGLVVALSTVPVHADSIGPTFALQQGPGVTPNVGNGSNVLLGQGVPLLSPTLITRYLSGNYLAFVSSLGQGTGPGYGRMDLTLTLAGVTYTTGAVVNGVDSCVNSFALPRNFYRPTDGVLTVRFHGDVREYAFQFIEPVPEPGTWIMLSTGIGLVPWMWRRWPR